MTKEIIIPEFEPSIDSKSCTKLVDGKLIQFHRGEILYYKAYDRIPELIKHQTEDPTFFVHPTCFSSGDMFIYFYAQLTEHELSKMRMEDICD